MARQRMRRTHYCLTCEREFSPVDRGILSGIAPCEEGEGFCAIVYGWMVPVPETPVDEGQGPEGPPSAAAV